MPNLRDKLLLAVEGLPAKSGPSEFDGESIGLEAEFESPILEWIEPWPEDLILIEARRLEGVLIHLELEVAAELGFDVYVFKGDYYTMDDVAISVHNYDWNDHYIAGQVTRPAYLRINASYSVQTGEIVAIDLIELSVRTAPHL